MAIRTKRYTNGIILKPSILGDISLSDAVNGLIVYDSQNHKLIVKISGANREIVTLDQNQVLTNKTINTNQNTIQVSASGVSATELDAALEEIKGLIDDTSGAEIEIFNSTITVGTTAPSVTGVLHHKLSDDVDLKKATLQLFGKNDKYTGTMQIDVKKNLTPDDTGMVSVFSPTGKPSINFQVADSDVTFNSDLNNKFPNISIFTRILVQTVGSEKKYLIAGSFNYNSDTSKSHLIRLNIDGSEDTTFTENAVRTGSSPNFNSGINDIIIDSDGKILVAGNFSNYKNSGINCLIKLNADGTFDETDVFNENMVGKFTINVPANIGESCRQIRIQNSNIFYHKYKYISVGVYRDAIIKATSSGILDGSFLPSDFTGLGVIETTSQYVYAGGSFTNYGGSTNLNNAVRLNILDGSIDGNFTAATQNKFNDRVNSINVQSDNKIVFSGQFTNYGTISGLNYIVRLNSDLSVDTAFQSNVLNKFPVISGNFIQSELDSNNKILIFGKFSHSTVIANLMRLNSDGSEDKAFNYFTSTINEVGNFINNIALDANYILYPITPTGLVANLKRITNYPERYNEYALSSSSKDEGKIPTFQLNEGEFVRLDISSIPPNYVGTIQVVLTGVKRI